MLASNTAPLPRAAPPTRPLRLLLAAAVALPLLVTVAGAWLSWRQAWIAETREVVDAAEAAADFARRVFDGLVLRLERAEDILAGLDDAAIRAREAELHAALHRAATIGQRTDEREPYIFVYDRDAVPLVASSTYPVPNDTRFASREFNTVLRDPGAPALHVSPVYQGGLSGHPYFALSRRRGRTGNGLAPDAYDGVINASVYVASAEAALRRLASRAGGDVLTLLREDGMVLARSVPVPPGSRLPQDAGVTEALQRGETAIFRSGRSPLDGVARIAAYRRVEGYPVYAAAARPNDAVLQRWLGTVTPLLAAGFPASFGLLALALMVRRGQRDLASANAGLERRVAERTAALEASERRNAEVLGSIGEQLCAVDAEGRVSYVSASALAFWGKSSGELLGRRFDDAFPEAVGSPAWEAKRLAMEMREELHLCVRSTLTGRWVELDIYPLPDGGITVAFRDLHDKRLLELERQRAEAALKDSEEWLRLAQEAGEIGAWEADLATGSRRWSDGNYRLWGVAPGTAVTLDLIWPMIHPADRARMQEATEDARNTRGRLPPIEFRIRRASDGEERVLLSWGEVMLGPDGRPARHIGLMHDITERRAAQAALRVGEARLQAAVAGARLGIWERHLPTSTGRWDARATEIYGGLTPDRCSPDLAEWRARVHPDDQPARIAAIARAVAPGGPESYEAEFRFRRDDGGWNWVAVHGTVVERDPATGVGTRLVGVTQDLTERRNAEEALRLSEERLRLAQEAGGVGSWEWTVGTGALHWSESCHRLHGTDARQAPDFETWRQGIHPEDRTAVDALVQDILQGRRDHWESEFRFTRPADGVERWIAGRGQVVRDAATGAAVSMRGVALDVTERRLAQERLMLLAREVDHRAKNALAVVQAAVRLAPKDDAQAFARAVEGRVGALARAQVMLADAAWQGTDLRVLASGTLAAFLPAGPATLAVADAAAVLEGPPVQLAAAATQPISLALHELATNAAKYGALSHPGGQVLLRWHLDRAARLLRLTWQERNGPALGTPPHRNGFGTRVIEGTIRDQLGGTVERFWEAGGLRCEIALPLGRSLARHDPGEADPPAPLHQATA